MTRVELPYLFKAGFSSSILGIFSMQQECIPVGCVPSAAVAISPATYAWPLPCMPPLPYMPPAIPAPCGTHPLPRMPPCHAHPQRGQTDTCKNITFPQLLLRTVKRQFYTNQVNSWFFSFHFCILERVTYVKSPILSLFSTSGIGQNKDWTLTSLHLHVLYNFGWFISVLTRNDSEFPIKPTGIITGK